MSKQDLIEEVAALAVQAWRDGRTADAIALEGECNRLVVEAYGE